ncbi:MAG: hypothetical protein J7L42_03705 [Elusimicrobia bacterium]|nr:hypothetical protein [Elusimicrobiota bacterium]
MNVFKEFFQFAWQNKKFWLIPIILILIILGIFIVFFESAAVAPFIYTLF